MPFDKTQVARRQLGTALALFLEDYDPVSVHTLACAGGEIAEHLARKAGEQPFTDHVLANFPDFDIKPIRRVQKQYCNPFKHATTQGGNERDDKDLLERFDDTVNEHALFVGWYDYVRAVGALPLEAQVFTDQKKALREVIAHYRNDRELMSHPATDPTPLIL